MSSLSFIVWYPNKYSASLHKVIIILTLTLFAHSLMVINIPIELESIVLIALFKSFIIDRRIITGIGGWEDDSAILVNRPNRIIPLLWL